ncbi:MAG: biotin/lipoyl-binding protein, partial [Planctomycetota bacterium]
MTFALLLLLSFLQEPGAGLRAVRVSVVRPETATLHRVLVVPAFVEPFEEARLVARVTGYIVDLPVEEGDRLQRGDLVARLAAPELDAGLARAQAELAQARAEVQSAESQWKSRQAAAEAARIEFE